MSLALAACGGASTDDTASSTDGASSINTASPTETESLAMVDETTAVNESAGPVEAIPVGANVPLTTVTNVANACEGTTFSNLAPETTEPRKIAFVQNYQNAEGTFGLAPEVALGDAQYDYVGDDLLNLDYVGCIVEVSRDRSEVECALNTEDGSAVEVYELNLAVRIIDAATGAEVAVEPIVASLKECPTEIQTDAVLLAPVDIEGLRLAAESHLAR